MRDHMGNASGISKRLLKLRVDLIKDIVDQSDLNTEEAVSIVSSNLVGWRKAISGFTGEVIRAAPEAVRLLELQVREVVLQAETSWLSASQLRKQFKGDSEDLNDKLLRAHDDLVNRIVDQAGLSPQIAGDIVDRHFAGLRRPPRGQASLHASPLLVELLEHEGTLQQRNQVKEQYCRG